MGAGLQMRRRTDLIQLSVAVESSVAEVGQAVRAVVRGRSSLVGPDRRDILCSSRGERVSIERILLESP